MVYGRIHTSEERITELEERHNEIHLRSQNMEENFMSTDLLHLYRRSMR
jgi:hypothetical protein